MSWRTLFLEINLTGELCSGIIICWRKSSGEMSPGEIFLGEKCDEFIEKPCMTKMASSAITNGMIPPMVLIGA